MDQDVVRGLLAEVGPGEAQAISVALRLDEPHRSGSGVAAEVTASPVEVARGAGRTDNDETGDTREANVARQVPAITGACLMIDKALYDRVGGLSASYVQGDYEDSDLCLRLAEIGRKSWYLPTVALYHLEGQSYPSSERELISEFNKWLHTQRWQERLREAELTQMPGGERW